MSADLAGLLYLVASICFILALRGLSHPTTSRTGNIYGMVGMAIAIFTTVALPGVVNYGLILAGIVLASVCGVVFHVVALAVDPVAARGPVALCLFVLLACLDATNMCRPQNHLALP